MSLEDKVIVLKKIKYSEADLVLQTINRQGTQLSFLARSALKSKKRFGGGILEPTHYLQVTYKPSRREGGLLTLEEATLIHDFKGIRDNYDRLQLALYFLKLISKVSLEGDLNNENNFNLLGHGLKALEKEVDLSHLKVFFEVKYLHYQGVLELNESFSQILKTPLNAIDFSRSQEDLILVQRQISSELHHFLSL